MTLRRLGVRVRAVDKTVESGTTSRAIVVQPRTLELYRRQDGRVYTVMPVAAPAESPCANVSGRSVVSLAKTGPARPSVAIEPSRADHETSTMAGVKD